MKNRLFAVIGATLAVGMYAGPAQAGTTAYTDFTDYENASTGLTLGDFTGIPTPNQGDMGQGSFGSYNPLSYATVSLLEMPNTSNLAGVTFSTTNINSDSTLADVNVDSPNFYGSSDLDVPYAVNSVYSGGGADVLDITLPTAATAFALNFNTLFTSTTATFTLNNGYSTTFENTATTSSTTGTSTLDFLGFTSTTPFTSITFSVPNGFSWVVADFSYGTALLIPAVPEPSTWAMMLVGFAAIGVMARRRSGLVPRFS